MNSVCNFVSEFLYKSQSPAATRFSISFFDFYQVTFSVLNTQRTRLVRVRMERSTSSASSLSSEESGKLPGEVPAAKYIGKRAKRDGHTPPCVRTCMRNDQRHLLSVVAVVVDCVPCFEAYTIATQF